MVYGGGGGSIGGGSGPDRHSSRGPASAHPYQRRHPAEGLRPSHYHHHSSSHHQQNTRHYGTSGGTSGGGIGASREPVSEETLHSLDLLLKSPAFYTTGVPLAFSEFLQIVGLHLGGDPKLAAEKYEEYRENFHGKQYISFFEQHKHSQWFLERYDPQVAKEEAERLQKTYEKNYQLFIMDLAAGKLDGLSLEQPQMSQRPPPPPRRRSLPAYGDHEEEEEEDRNHEDDHNDQEDGREDGEQGRADNNNADPENTTSGATQLLLEPVDTCLRTPNEATSDPEELRRRPPSLLIKSIPVTATRAMLESRLQQDPDFAYLALGPPNARKRFSRVGYVVLKDGASAQAALDRLEGFQLELPLAPGHRNSSITITSPAEEQAGSKQEASSVDDMDTDKNAAEPNSATPPTTMQFIFHLCVVEEFPETYMDKVTSDAASEPLRLCCDLEQARDLARHFNQKYGFAVDPLAPVAPLSHEQAPTRELIRNAPVDDVKRSLDLYLVYLRRVFFFCYYCGREKSTSAEALNRSCGTHHWRKPRTDSKYGAAIETRRVNWKKRVDHIVDAYLDGLSVQQLRDLGHQDPETDVANFIASNVLYVAPQKYRCRFPNCPKVFKGDEFVRKHIQNKHPEGVEEYRKRSILLNSYLADPFKLSFADAIAAKPTPAIQGYNAVGGSRAPHSGREEEMSGPPQFMVPLENIPSIFKSSLYQLSRRHTAERGYAGEKRFPYSSSYDRRPSMQDMRPLEGAHTATTTLMMGPGGRKPVSYQDLDAAVVGETKEDVVMDYD